MKDVRLSELDAAKVDELNNEEIAAAGASLAGDNVVHLHAVDDDDGAGAEDWRAVVDRLAVLPPIECEQRLKREADLLGVPPATLRAEVKKERNRSGSKPPCEQSAVEHIDIGALELSAAAIIDSDDVLGLFEKVWSRVMAGEQRNARLLYLMTTTRLFDKCMSGAIKGPSSAGKSEIRHRVLDFMPPEDVVAFSTLSDKALLYFDGDFPHKILSMGEAAGAEEQSLQDYLLRELLSAGRLVYPVVQKIGNELMTITIEKNGPVCFFVTTTKAALHPENETRLMSIEVDDSDVQTLSVIGKVAEAVGLNAERTVIDHEPWRNFQRWLAVGNCSVVVPFARELGQLIPPRSVRLRRDFSQILLAIKAHALLHRNHRQLDDRGQIVAELELDYRPVAKLLGGIVAEASGTSVSKEDQATIDAVKKATANLAADEGAASDKIAKLLKLDQSAAWRRLNKAILKGFVVNLETRHRQPGRYRLTNQEVEAELLLPAPEAIAECIASGGSKTAHTCIWSQNDEAQQGDNVCMDGCIRDANDETECKPDETECRPYAQPHAYANHLDNNEKSHPYARMPGFQGSERESELSDQAAQEGYPELPAFLDRRGADVCPACDGLGCPTCQPRRFGIGG